jgi:hypothetical protein
MLIEPGLQDDGGGFGIEAHLTFVAAVLRFGFEGAVTLVGEFDRQPVAPGELAREALAARSEFMGTFAVGVGRAARRPPRPGARRC